MAQLDRLLALFVQSMVVPALLMVAFARPAPGAAERMGRRVRPDTHSHARRAKLAA